MTIKAILIGAHGVGKTSILTRVKEDMFSAVYEPTIGVDFGIHVSTDGNHAIKYQVWDTVGAEKFRLANRGLYRGCMIAILVFDVAYRDSFECLDYRYGEACNAFEACEVNMPEMLVIGNKGDLSLKRLVSQDEAEAWALKKEAFYLDYSAKEDSRAVIIAKLNEIVDKIMLNQ